MSTDCTRCIGIVWAFVGTAAREDQDDGSTKDCLIEDVKLISTLGPVREPSPFHLGSHTGLRVTMRTGGHSDVFLFEAMDSSSCHAWYRAMKLAMDELHGSSAPSWESRTPEAKESLVQRLLQASNPYSGDFYPAEWVEKTASLPEGQPSQLNTGRFLRIQEGLTL
eukprot:COSAG02_NODE_7120_length_3173_cov_33.267421_1_plen_165_part_10